MKDNGDKLPKEFENPELLSLLKCFLDVYEKNSQEAAQSAAQIARLSNQKLQHAFAGLAVSILIAVSGFLLSKYFEESRHRGENAQAEIQRRLNKLEEISVALTEVRRVKDDVLIDCGTQFIDNRDIEHKRLKARINLIKACRNADFYFGEKVYAEAAAFIAWESSFKDYCSNELPNDLVWREKQKSIENLMREHFPKDTFAHNKTN